MNKSETEVGAAGSRLRATAEGSLTPRRILRTGPGIASWDKIAEFSGSGMMPGRR
jgi:hypothetical protein